VKFKVLNIEKEIAKQGMAEQSMDIVFGANVIHATTNIGRTLEQVAKLLKPGGLFVLNEVTQRQEFTTLTFGLTDGWWLYEDESERIPDAPLLTPGLWRAALTGAGFGQVRVIGQNESQDRMQSVIIAENRAVHRRKGQQDLDLVPEAATDAAPEPAPPRPAQQTPVAMQEGGKEHLRDHLFTLFAQVLKMDRDELEEDETYENYGVDSLMVMEINRELGKVFGKLPGTLLFEQITIRQLCDYLWEHHRDKFVQQFEVPQEPVPATVQDAEPEPVPLPQRNGKGSSTIREYVYSLSDAEVESLFAKMLGK
jgi:acyl carrier protein